MTIALKYCGGCNPRYDRAALLSCAKSNFPQVDFATGDAALAEAAGVLLLCGCPSRCAAVPAGPAGSNYFVAAAQADWPALAAWIQTGLDAQKNR
ncbi:MAG: hypothetical protein GXY32_06490 [Ruminococcaceae bacterium]|nr:hypothetical protein [Oscillospiraceae bacterium]